MKGFSTVLFILYLILGIYLINSAFSFVDLPQALGSLDKWIVLAGGIFLILGAINHYRLNRYSY